MPARARLVSAVSVAIAVLITAKCAGHSRPDSTPAMPGPMAWELRAGDKRGDERLVCQSGSGRDCVLEATTGEHRMLAILGVHLRAQGEQTNYVGTVTVPFIEGGTGAASEVSVRVPPGERPVSRTIMGVVTRRPGEYTMTFALDAIVEGGMAPARLYEDVPVTVR